MADLQLALIIAPPGRLRDSLRVLLRASERVTRIAMADDGRSGLRQIAALNPGLVVIDADLPEDEAWHIAPIMGRSTSECGCLIITHNPQQAHRAHQIGVAAILADDFSTAAFLQAVPANTQQGD